MVESAAARTGSRPLQGGPPLWLLGAVSTGLLLAALAVSAALGGVVPSPYDPAGAIRAYFLAQPDAVRASGVLLFGSSVPLAIYAATASARLRQLGVNRAGVGGRPVHAGPGAVSGRVGEGE
jgi:hypothetical protein